MRNATGHDGTVVVTGTVERDLRIDCEEGGVTYELSHSAGTARLGAEGLAHHHEGVRLYVAWGTVGPVDGQTLDVLEVGTSWSKGRAGLCVTVPQPGRPEPLTRLTVEELEPGDAEQVTAALLAAAGDAEPR